MQQLLAEKQCLTQQVQVLSSKKLQAVQQVTQLETVVQQLTDAEHAARAAFSDTSQQTQQAQVVKLAQRAEQLGADNAELKVSKVALRWFAKSLKRQLYLWCDAAELCRDQLAQQISDLADDKLELGRQIEGWIAHTDELAQQSKDLIDETSDLSQQLEESHAKNSQLTQQAEVMTAEQSALRQQLQEQLLRADRAEEEVQQGQGEVERAVARLQHEAPRHSELCSANQQVNDLMHCCLLQEMTTQLPVSHGMGWGCGRGQKGAHTCCHKLYGSHPQTGCACMSQHRLGLLTMNVAAAVNQIVS